MSDIKPIFLDNDYEIDVYYRNKNADTGVLKPTTDLQIVTWLSFSDKGSPISAELSKTCAQRSRAPGHFFSIMDGDVLREFLPGHNSVFLVVGDGVNVLTSDEVPVYTSRRAAGVF